ncbi:MAG: sigma-70 family RNA polymerase sigma factor [Lachnospiraceae bacterium]|nr:sigma-70 family RNA polymerase sigma factor [Lachnospiraceae bacterium]
MITLVFDTEEEKDKFIALYETYGKTVYYTLKRFPIDEHTIEDLSQDIYIKLADHLDNIDLADFKKTQNYVITIVRNYCMSYLRKYSKNQEELMEDVPSIGNNAGNIEQYIINKEQIMQLADEIGQLDDIYKSVLELKYVNEFTDDEIAAFLKIKKKTVEMRLYRAKKMLRARLGEKENAGQI